MTAVAVAVIEETLKMLDGEIEPFGLDQLLAPVPDADQVVIDNIMTSEMEANIVASVVSEDRIDGLCLVLADKTGREALMKDDYLPFVGRIICRMAHDAGWTVYLAMPNPCRLPEAVIVTPEGMCIQLLAGEKRKVKCWPDFDPELMRDQIAVISSNKSGS